MSKKFKIILLSVAIISIIGSITYNYVLHGGARDLSSEKSDFSVDSKTIVSEFTNNSDFANKKYLEKAIEVSGTITNANHTVVTIDNNVVCNFKVANKDAKINEKVIIKGRVVGYDDLMAELKLDQCDIIIK